MDDDDLRKPPLSMRKTNLARLLHGRPDGIFISEFEQGEIGPDLFRKACEFGLEGKIALLAWYVAADRLLSEPLIRTAPSVVETYHLHARPRLLTVVSK